MPDNRFDALLRISELLATAATEEERLAALNAVFENDLGMRRMTLLISSASGEELVYESSRGVTHGGTAVQYRRGEGLIGKVLQTGAPVVAPRISAIPDFRNRIHNRERSEIERHGFICVPILFGKETIGALAADVPCAEGRDLEEDGRFMCVVAGMLSHDVKLRREGFLANRALRAENLRLMSQFGSLEAGNLIGCSDKMRGVYQRIAQVAPSDTIALIRGESGTGKELVASAIHYSSRRADKPFVKVNCAALSENLLESELFGHERGAFTGAFAARSGRLQEAEGGTLFLDEIGDFSPGIQVKLLRLLQEKEYSVVGTNTLRKADVRFVAATNRDLEDAVAKETFRQDLYYRINVFPLYLPPLRERREDILPLANHFVEKYAAIMKKDVRRISTTAIDMLMAYHWPGNVRELENCIQHGVLVCSGAAICGLDLPPTLAMPEEAGHATVAGSLQERVDRLERDMITDALKRTRGNVAASARELGITPRMVRYKLGKLGIDASRLGDSA